jgi:LPS export ABC transporter protein LptC
LKILKQYKTINIPTTFVVGMFVLLMFGLTSCENDLDHVKRVTATDQTPDQITNDLHTFYSDSGIVQYEIIASRMEVYQSPNQKTYFKNGFEVNYFNKSGEKISKLTADYCEIIEKSNLVVCKNNVTFTNYEKQQTLKTEELFWDQKYKKIRTTKKFFIDSPTTEAKGVGLEADETFSTYSMHNFSLIYKDTTDGFIKNE